jgi:ABC-type dipeptide/oligopeptide/nickel transport system ATPase component
MVGESGCGKSVTALSIMRLLRTPPARIASGEVRFLGEDLLRLDEGRTSHRQSARCPGNEAEVTGRNGKTRAR